MEGVGNERKRKQMPEYEAAAAWRFSFCLEGDNLLIGRRGISPCRRDAEEEEEPRPCGITALSLCWGCRLAAHPLSFRASAIPAS